MCELKEQVSRMPAWIGLCMVLRPRQHSIGYMGDRFLQVKRPNQQYQSTEGTHRLHKNTIRTHKLKTQQIP